MSQPVKEMFGRIACRYDLLNRLLSARRDVGWRAKALALIEERPERVLDLACGTFDLALQALAAGKATTVHGCDFAQPMLVAGRGKIAGRPVSATVGDALRLPYADGSFDAAMCAYGWRNFDDPAAALRELRRVLVPDGQLLILEFFRPSTLWTRSFYATFGRIAPLAGALIARDAGAYRYLHDSVQGFLSPGQAQDLLAGEGFTGVRSASCFGGVSHALWARRSP